MSSKKLFEDLDNRISNISTINKDIKKPNTLKESLKFAKNPFYDRLGKIAKREIDDSIYNENIMKSSVDEYFGLQSQNDISFPTQFNNDQDLNKLQKMYNAFTKVQSTEDIKNNILKLRLLFSEIEPRQGIVSEVIKSLKNYEIEEILKNKKKYMDLFKKYLSNQNARDVNANSYLDLINDVMPNASSGDLIDFNELPNDNTKSNNDVEIPIGIPIDNIKIPIDNIDDFITRDRKITNKIIRDFCQDLVIQTKSNDTKPRLIELINKHFNNDFDMFKMEWDNFNNPKKGLGLKKKKLKIIKGCGLIPQTISKVKQLGRSFLMLRKLFFDNILSLKYTNNLVAYPNFHNVKVSDELKNIIINCLEKVPPGQDDIINLSKDEKIIYLRICLLCGLNKDFFENKKELLRDIKNDFEVGQGEIEAGNNNEELIYKVKMLAQVLKEANCISHKDLKQLQRELEV